MIPTPERVVIVGAGQAGGDLAASLREKGFEGHVTLIGDEEFAPYSRPQLSKAYLRGEKGAEDLLVRAELMYERHGIKLVLGRRVVDIDRAERHCVLDNSTRYPYDVLVLATGGTSRLIDDPKLGAAPNVFTLRSVKDTDRLRSVLVPGSKLVILGGGYVGLEAAAVARELDLDVTVVERQERLLARVTAPPLADFIEAKHAANGVRVLVGRSVEDIQVGLDGRLVAIELNGADVLPIDICLVAVGLQPTSDLASAAGLPVADGILVNDNLCTSDPRIYAIGDVARHPCPERFGTRRLESVANASDQARRLADTLVGSEAPPPAVPWFWSDQFDLKIQLVGLRDVRDDVVVRQSDDGLAVFYIRKEQIRAAEVVSSPKDFMMAKKLVTCRAVVDKDQLADPRVPLKSLIPSS